MKFIQRELIARFELLILSYLALLDFHKLLHEGNSIRDNTVVTFIHFGKKKILLECALVFFNFTFLATFYFLSR